jgi:hypothetical protein
VRSCAMALSAAQRREARRIAEEMSAIAESGEVLPGSIVSRHTRCQRPGCRCMGDPPQPHGPYFQWTRKVTAKTVGHWLSPEQAAEYEGFVENHRRLKELLGRLEQLGLATLEADPRTRRKR